MIARLLTGKDVSPPGADCAKCPRSGGVYVPGCGPERAELVLVGEAPGKQEARMGKPFVGPSGKLLDRVLADAGIERGACYITNACLCVGPANPKAKEVAACRERLLAEVVSRSPKLVVVMGNPALRAVLGRTNISRERGAFVWSEELSAFVLPTYHPAAVLRSPGLYADLLNDFRLVAKALAGGGEATGKRMKVKQELSVEHTVVSNVEDLLTEIERASSGGDLLAVDVETASDGSLLCLSMAWENGRAVVVPGELARRCAGALDRLFASKCLVGHNFQFDLRVLWRNGMPSARTGKDTLLLAYSLDERKGKHSLGDVVREQLNVPDHKRPMEKYKNCMEKAPVVQLYRYNALDAAYTYFLVGVLEPLVDQDGHRVLNTLLYPASDVLARMTAVGTMVDLPYIHELDKQISIELAEKLEELHKLAGRQFNPNSPKQLVNLLYKELNLPIPVHLGKMSSDEEHLEFLAEYHPLPKRILEYRKRAKFLNTYVRGMAKAADAEARVHTTFNLGGTVTGRLSSSKPNLQNIGRAKENRDMFMATPRWAMVECDMCLAGDTLIETPYGPKPIADMKEGDIVYSYADRKVTAGRVTRKVFVGVENVVRVTLDNGEQIICTPDHRFLVMFQRRRVGARGGTLPMVVEEVCASDLTRGARLVPFHRIIADGYNLLYAHGRCNYVKEADVVAEATFGKKPPGHHVHHKNGVRNDDRPENLVYLPRRDHLSRHGKENYRKQDHSKRIANLKRVLATKDWNGPNNPRFGHRAGPALECAYCGKRFYRPPSRKAKFCSVACYRAFAIANGYHSKPRARTYTRTCLFCGQSFTAHAYNAVWCSKECYRNARRNVSNHKVVSVERLSVQVPVYSITVEPHHNYALRAGVFVKNSQSELRVLAWFSQDKKFLEAFNSGVDIHTANAALMFDVPVEAVTKELRQSVKPLNFGVIYGMTSQSLAKELNVSIERADELMKKFFSTFRRAHEWIEDTKQEVLRTGYLKTPFGRVRRFPFISKENMAEQLRQAVNFLIQSVSSDITLSAVIRLGKKLWDDPTTRLLLTVHDSILLETLDNPVEVAHTVSREMMQNVLDGSVPFVADAKVGEKWGSLEPVD